MKRDDVGKALLDLAWAMLEGAATVSRSMSRVSGRNLTRLHLMDDVRDLRNVPVDGDALAAFRDEVQR